MLNNYTDDILFSDNNIPVCRYEKILNWREMSLMLGQDLFTCSFFANRDVQRDTRTEIFSWPAIISTDNGRLRGILQKGVAENHFHLFGSSRTFELAWIAMMNSEAIIADTAKAFKRQLNHDVLGRTEYGKSPLRERLKQAAIIRVQLFDYLMGNSNDEETNNRIINGLNDSVCAEIGAKCSQFMYGYRTPETGAFLDYALIKGLHNDNYKYNRALVGERFFLYECFKQVYKGTSPPNFYDLFYLYLLIKSQFRGEMIQLNKRVGFKNFSDYEERKDISLENDKNYSREIVNIAIKEVRAENNIVSFETRITPKDTAKKMKSRLCDIIEPFCQKDDIFDIPSLSEQLENLQFFFVLHFPKAADKPTLKEEFIEKCRNHTIRKANRKRALAVAGLLNKYPYFRKVIKGIDGCANEIGCRPEVMAHEFRFLSNFVPDSPDLFLYNPESFIIKRTFHAGEDFLDLTDGLRAIDEAIMFLELKRGDRLGHALALGLNSEEYYTAKGLRVSLPRQDLLDNICWLLCRSREFGVTIKPVLRERLKRTFHEIAQKIYKDYYNDYRDIDFQNIEFYYDSWKLRGDSPKLYRSGEYRKSTAFIDGYEKHGVSDKNKTSRYNKSECLYYLYHWDYSVRMAGEQPDELIIDIDFIRLVHQMQNAVQKHIEELGICVESNPSSNYLIASSRLRFDNHPILSFNNLGLESDLSESVKSMQLSVSINTDDQGVFDTSLENEYAVMASALERVKSPCGNKRYLSAQVYRWLDQVRQMGIEQSFDVKKPRQ
jgi:hypothetical protein